jgi:antitoxin ParD1/3/4
MPNLTIDVPEEVARHIQAKVESGAYPDESAFVSEAIRHSISEEVETERWLRDEVLPTLEAYDRNPDDVLTGEDVFRSVTEHLLKLERKSA